MKKTKKAYTELLNEIYARMNNDDTFKELSYLTNPDRVTAISHDTLLSFISSGTCGALMRIVDPEQFNQGYEKWCDTKEVTHG